MLEGLSGPETVESRGNTIQNPSGAWPAREQQGAERSSPSGLLPWAVLLVSAALSLVSLGVALALYRVSSNREHADKQWAGSVARTLDHLDQAVERFNRAVFALYEENLMLSRGMEPKGASLHPASPENGIAPHFSGKPSRSSSVGERNPPALSGVPGRGTKTFPDGASRIRFGDTSARMEPEARIRIVQDSIIDAVVQIVHLAGETTAGDLYAILKNRCSEKELLEALARAQEAGILTWEGPKDTVRTPLKGR